MAGIGKEHPEPVSYTHLEEIAVETLGEPMQVIGVVKDYHQQALNKGYTGVMLFHKDKIDWIPQRLSLIHIFETEKQ